MATPVTKRTKTMLVVTELEFEEDVAVETVEVLVNTHLSDMLAFSKLIEASLKSIKVKYQ